MANHHESVNVSTSTREPAVESFRNLDNSLGKSPNSPNLTTTDRLNIQHPPPFSSDPLSDSASDDMTFSSSPVLYPASSSPQVPLKTKKRRLFQPFPAEQVAKKARIKGGFLEDSDDEGDNGGVSLPVVSKDTASILEIPTLPTMLESVGVCGQIHQNDTVPEDAPSSPSLPPIPRSFMRRLPARMISAQTASGGTLNIPLRKKSAAISYEETIAQRSVAAPGRARKAYYGIDIHQLMADASTQRQLDEFAKQSKAEQAALHPTIETEAIVQPNASNTMVHQMWTEKYRAKKFTELVGDERTHRSVLRWLKAWDEVVFPGSSKTKLMRGSDDRYQDQQEHRKILLLTGPPGLGKTTLAHVCAKQAGYEVLEINASDDRSRDIVKGKIKDVLGTENVRGIKEQGKARKAGRPVCVIVDEVDGVTTGSTSSGGEGGFIKALIDLVQLDQRNSLQTGNSEINKSTKKKGDKFRMLRPLILVCNDVYAPSLRPLRTSSIAEVIHVRKAPMDKVIARVKTVFEKERIPCDTDAVRRLCENAWGLAMRKQRTLGSRGAGEGDIRGVLVQAEWLAHKLRAGGPGTRLTRKWLEPQLGETQSGHKGLGRGGVREVVERVFIEGAGLPNLPVALSADDQRLIAESKVATIGVSDLRKRAAISALREMADTCGEHDRLMADCFAAYPSQVFQDDVQLTKPNAGYDWLHFHDCLSSRVYSGQDWELMPYLSTGACGFHHLFSSIDRGSKVWQEEKGEDEKVESHPFSGPKADFAAYEAQKQNRTLLTELQSSFSASLLRLFSSVDNIAMELIPNLGKMFAPDVKPIVIGGSGGSASTASVRKETEKNCVKNAVRTMLALDVSFEKARVEIEGGGAHSNAGYVYRMEPPLDSLMTFYLDKTSSSTAPVRYAIRQVLDQELKKEKLLANSVARHARSSIYPEDIAAADEDKENRNPVEKAKEAMAKAPLTKRDFFGRIVNDVRPRSMGNGAIDLTKVGKDDKRVWVSFHEGFSNAVRKPITLKELMDSF